MSRPTLIASTSDAPWLPGGSTAEVWAGTEVEVPDTCIIVRLLLTRADADGRRFFCLPTYRGLDLPTMSLGTGPEQMSVADALSLLSERVLGRAELELICLGYVRNVVPARDADYVYPTPWAHVPVFTLPPAVETLPVVTGSWLTLDAARPDLSGRHWWPIVEHHLAASRSG